MTQEKLHLVIAKILYEFPKGLRIKEIVERIASDKPYLRPKDGKLPDYNQIWGRIGNYPKLFETSSKGIISLRPQSNVERRLFRLTWNTKGWEFPVFHDWDTKKQGNTDVAFENQYGFGGEEWLFNARYQVDGYQYGYIRGVKDLPINIEYLDHADLFTINQMTGERYLVGKIDYLEVIREGSPEALIAAKLYKKYLSLFKEEIEAAKGDKSGVDIEGFSANVRFKINGDELFIKPILIPALKGRKYNRFIPYKVDYSLQLILDRFKPHSQFQFIRV